MKKFAGTKPLAEIKTQCRAAGVAFDDYNFRTTGADHVCLGAAQIDMTRPDGTAFVNASDNSPHGWVMFNTFNGRFFGSTPEGVRFNSDLTLHDDEPWFQQLLSFFYVEKKSVAV